MSHAIVVGAHGNAGGGTADVLADSSFDVAHVGGLVREAVETP